MGYRGGIWIPGVLCIGSSSNRMIGVELQLGFPRGVQMIKNVFNIGT